MGKILFTEIYMLGLIFMFLNIASRALFGTITCKQVFVAIFFCFIWPLALFSEKGQARLFISLKNF